MPRLSSRFPSPRREPTGFTLVELLVSMVVLALILVLTAQLVNSASQTVTGSNKRTDSDGQSRLVFSRIGQDIARMAKRSDVDFSTFKQPAVNQTANPATNLPAINQPANLQDGSDTLRDHNDHLAFYSEVVGGYTPGGTGSPTAFSSTNRAPLSLVAYQVAAEPNGGSMTLRRLAKALGWDPESTGSWANPIYLPLKLTDLQVKKSSTQVQAAIQLFSAVPSDPAGEVDGDYSTIGDLVFRLEYSYLLKPNPANTANPAARLSVVPYDTTLGTPPHNTVSGLRDVAAIVVTLGILDANSRALTTSDRTLAKLINVFPDAVDGQDTLKVWQDVLLNRVSGQDFAVAAGLPRTAATGVRLYQRTFYLEPK